MYNKIIIPALAASIITNCIMGYYLNQTTSDLKNAENENRLHIEEIKKLNTQISSAEIPEGYEIETEPLKKPAENRVKNRTYPNIYIPQRSAEPYIPSQVYRPAYIPEENQRALPNYPTADTNLYRGAKALENIDTNIMLDSMFQQPNVIYLYPEY
ncbi:MAG: hypothetical protein DKM22_04195 [Candidatus Melainabacteria bacterium]|nr:MAG: hypothetical protein DKM22_04195 [Candidatus Melainabacteria bacterium]